MIKLLSALILAVVSILPDSPFRPTAGGEFYRLEFLPYLNWFVPFDTCLRVTQAWLVAVALYYTYDMVMDVVRRLVLDKL